MAEAADHHAGRQTAATRRRDAIVLFDGKDLSAWNGADTWKIEDGADGRRPATMIETKQQFGDCQLHIEWSAPTPAKGEGQGRGNSGVFFGPYELQVLDSYENETYFDGQAGAIYKQTPPMVNAMRQPGEWNVYDVIWTAPRFNDDGTLASPAFITALHNGVVIQNHFQLLGDTPFNRPPQYNKHDGRAADPPAGPRQPGAVPQHLGPRVEADRGEAGEGAEYEDEGEGWRLETVGWRFGGMLDAGCWMEEG